MWNVTSCLQALVFHIYGRLGSWFRPTFLLAFCFSHPSPNLAVLPAVSLSACHHWGRSIKSDVFIFFRCQDRIFLFPSPTSRYPSHSPFCFYGLRDVITKLLISTSCQAGLEKSTSFSNFLFLGFLSPFLCVNQKDYLISLLELFAYRIFILFPFWEGIWHGGFNSGLHLRQAEIRGPCRFLSPESARSAAGLCPAVFSHARWPLGPGTMWAAWKKLTVSYQDRAASATPSAWSQHFPTRQLLIPKSPSALRAAGPRQAIRGPHDCICPPHRQSIPSEVILWQGTHSWVRDSSRKPISLCPWRKDLSKRPLDPHYGRILHIWVCNICLQD